MVDPMYTMTVHDSILNLILSFSTCIKSLYFFLKVSHQKVFVVLLTLYRESEASLSFNFEWPDLRAGVGALQQIKHPHFPTRLLLTCKDAAVRCVIPTSGNVLQTTLCKRGVDIAATAYSAGESQLQGRYQVQHKKFCRVLKFAIFAVQAGYLSYWRNTLFYWWRFPAYTNVQYLVLF